MDAFVYVALPIAGASFGARGEHRGRREPGRVRRRRRLTQSRSWSNTPSWEDMRACWRYHGPRSPSIVANEKSPRGARRRRSAGGSRTARRHRERGVVPPGPRRRTRGRGGLAAARGSATRRTRAQRGGLRGRDAPRAPDGVTSLHHAEVEAACTTSRQSPGDPITSTCSGSTGDRVLWHQAYGGARGGGRVAGGARSHRRPAVTAWAADRMEVFAVFDDGTLSGTATGTERHGIRGSRWGATLALGAAPAASSWGPGPARRVRRGGRRVDVAPLVGRKPVGRLGAAGLILQAGASGGRSGRRRLASLSLAPARRSPAKVRARPDRAASWALASQSARPSPGRDDPTARRPRPRDRSLATLPNDAGR